MQSELIHTEEREGFTIRLYAEPEDMSPRGQFMNEDGSDDEETIGKIESGFYAWFCAKVTASRPGVALNLGVEWLGGCCYDSPSAFVTDSSYYEDMVRGAIDEARKTLAKLCAC